MQRTLLPPNEKRPTHRSCKTKQPTVAENCATDGTLTSNFKGLLCIASACALGERIPKISDNDLLLVGSTDSMSIVLVVPWAGMRNAPAALFVSDENFVQNR